MYFITIFHNVLKYVCTPNEHGTWCIGGLEPLAPSDPHIARHHFMAVTTDVSCATTQRMDLSVRIVPKRAPEMLAIYVRFKTPQSCSQTLFRSHIFMEHCVSSALTVIVLNVNTSTLFRPIRKFEA